MGEWGGWLTVSREQEERVLTQYLFHSKSSRWESREDLKYDTSME